MLWNGKSLEEVDIVRIVDELIAYSVTRKTRRETLADAMEIHNSLNATAYGIISKSSQQVFDDIDRHGFFNIEGAPLIKELENDPAYRKALAAK